MALEAILDRIITQAKQNMTSQTTENKELANHSQIISTSKCKLCNDTGWVFGTNGYKRCECYEMDYVKRIWENFGVNPRDIKKIKDYESYNEQTSVAKQTAIRYVTQFNNIYTLEKNWLAFMGQPGGGKTHLAVGIGAALLEQKIPVVYMPYIEASRELKANTNDDEYYRRLSDRYTKAKVLIIDDLFKEKVRKGRLISEITPADMKHIYPILNYRYYNHLPTLISTECTPDMLNELDDALGGRILERSQNFGTVFKKDCNYRLRKFKAM